MSVSSVKVNVYVFMHVLFTHFKSKIFGFNQFLISRALSGYWHRNSSTLEIKEVTFSAKPRTTTPVMKDTWKCNSQTMQAIYRMQYNYECDGAVWTVHTKYCYCWIRYSEGSVCWCLQTSCSGLDWMSQDTQSNCPDHVGKSVCMVAVHVWTIKGK